jgi:hypothetical protein
MKTHGRIETLEGEFIVCPGDFIITGINGEYYPCKPDIFDKTYEPVSSSKDTAFCFDKLKSAGWVKIRKIPDNDGGGYNACVPSLGEFAVQGDGETEDEALCNMLCVLSERVSVYLKKFEVEYQYYNAWNNLKKRMNDGFDYSGDPEMFGVILLIMKELESEAG